jgi:hypothetical protein
MRPHPAGGPAQAVHDLAAPDRQDGPEGLADLKRDEIKVLETRALLVQSAHKERGGAQLV